MAPIISPQQEQARRQQILEAAERCFTTTGFSATRIADIAAEAGIGKGTVYEYWRSKEALLADTCIHACSRSESRMAELISTTTQVSASDLAEQNESPSDDANPNPATAINLTALAQSAGMHPVAAAHKVLHSVLSVLLSKSREEQVIFSELSTVAIGHPELLTEVREQLSAKYDNWISQAEALYQAGRASGFFVDLPHSRDCSQLIVAAVDGYVWQRLWFTEEAPEAAAHRITNAWLRLLLKEPQRLEEFLQ